MPTYSAVLMHGSRGGEGRYTFEGPEKLFKKTPVKIMRTFMEDLETRSPIGHIEYEINAAIKNKEAGVVTVIGDLHFDEDNGQPFMCMITKAEDDS